MAWWESWFGEDYLELYPHRGPDEARREVDFALERLCPDPEPILDLCCGNGRHSILFAERGFVPVGLDLSASQLEAARTQTPPLPLVRGDMRALPFADGSFRSVVNFFTSFGYFVSEGDNFAVVAEIVRALRPGGRFLCDTFGLAHVLSTLIPEESVQAGGRDYRIRRNWNPGTRRIEKQIEVRRDGATETFRESVRGYSGEELTEMFERAGLAVDSVWGDFEGAPAGPDSPRLILLAHKPAHA
ncbi:MAG TPA: methyltransferase domain-containing protein [Thermoanaerobaculia bacterium]